MPMPKPFTGRVTGLERYKLAGIQGLLFEDKATEDTVKTTPSKSEINQQSTRWTWGQKTQECLP